MSSAVFFRKLFELKVQWAHCACNQASPISHKRRSCGYVSTSTQPRRLSGRAHDLCDYAQATTLVVDELPRRCHVEAGLRSRRLERRRENFGATIVTMTPLQWVSRIRDPAAIDVTLMVVVAASSTTSIVCILELMIMKI